MTDESASVQSHLQIMQGVIQRMAANSSSCKTWCITIVSAILVVTAHKDKPELIWLALFPSILFFVLDAYYLALEKAFRASYNAFLKKLHTGQLQPEDLYAVAPEGSMEQHRVEAAKSFSVWGFYGFLIILVVIAWRFILQ
ncbi:hypothetical protein [Rhabdochromatium marinum]|uniref:hypothetical protein n=1 Tax=Rhabdochromatium marinum TaxID=48729 RepID=UPI001F5B6854|nr:hypothetical protein [Rhabdochromatium marinum]